jgi:hypothetical protein
VEVVINDGGREAAGYKGDTRDCACRSLSILTGRPYQEVYDTLNELAKAERPRGKKKRSNARTGYHTATMKRYLATLGWEWTATMQIGQGCKVHLREDELPSTGRLLINCSRHFTAVIDGVIHDTHDPSRGGTRCVYGYWTAP